MLLSFHLDPNELARTRTLRLHNTPKKMAFAPTPVNQPAKAFIASIERSQGYRFRLHDLLHACGFHMFANSLDWSRSSTPKQFPFLATAALYLALSLEHPDLCIRPHLGDFLSGFSHQIGVGMTAIIGSQAYDIPWDSLGPIPVSGRKTLDFFVQIDGDNYLYLEAKGTTSPQGRGRMLHSGYSKKEDTRKALMPRRMRNTAMMLIITQIAKQEDKHGRLIIADPAFDIPADAYREENQRAARYFHYATSAAFAGLTPVANTLLEVARSITLGQDYLLSNRTLQAEEATHFTALGHELLGCQWQFGDRCGDESIWFYHGINRQRLESIIEVGGLPPTEPFPSPPVQLELVDSPWFRIETDDRGARVLSYHPSGSFFGLGNYRWSDLAVIDPTEDLGERRLAMVE